MGAIAWSFWIACAWLVLIVMLSGCAQAPKELQDIHSATLARVPYKHYTGGFAYVPRNKVEAGNCAKQSWTNYVDAKAAGYQPEIVLCHVVSTGEGHAYTRVGEWALDGRFPWVMPVSEVGCQ